MGLNANGGENGFGNRKRGRETGKAQQIRIKQWLFSNCENIKRLNYGWNQ